MHIGNDDEAKCHVTWPRSAPWPMLPGMNFNASTPVQACTLLRAALWARSSGRVLRTSTARAARLLQPAALP